MEALNRPSFIHFLNKKKLFQYVAHYPAGTSILPLKTKTRFLRRRFKVLVNGVLVLAGLYLEKP